MKIKALTSQKVKALTSHEVMHFWTSFARFFVRSASRATEALMEKDRCSFPSQNYHSYLMQKQCSDDRQHSMRPLVLLHVQTRVAIKLDYIVNGQILQFAVCITARVIH